MTNGHGNQTTAQSRQLAPDQDADRRQVARQPERQDVRDDQPGDRGGDRPGRRGGCRRHRSGRQGRSQGVRLGPLAQDGRPRPRAADVQAGRPDRVAHRRAGRARNPRQRQADQREPPRRLAAGDRLPPLLRRLGRQDPRPDDPDPRPVLLLHPARAGGRRRADHPVELPDAHGRLEVGPGAGGRLHRRASSRPSRPRSRACAWASWRWRPASPRA